MKRSCLELLLDLARIPSITDSEDELAPIHQLEKFFTKNNVNYKKIGGKSGKENLVAEVGNGNGPIILLNSHFDVVPADSLMFDPKVKDDIVFGRGVADAKGPLTAMAVVLTELANQNISGKVIFCAVCDEETAGQNGTETLVELGITGDYTIVGEPTNFEVITGHSGILRFKIVMEGRSAHSATPGDGKNAILHLTRVIDKINNLNPACTLTTICGGVGLNLVPSQAQATYDVRWQKNTSSKIIIDQIKKIVDEIGDGKVEIITDSPPCNFDAKSIVARTALEVSGKKSTTTVSYGTDAVLIPQNKGVIVFGPGDSKFAHSNDEQIKIADVTTAVEYYQKIINRCLNK